MSSFVTKFTFSCFLNKCPLLEILGMNYFLEKSETILPDFLQQMLADIIQELRKMQAGPNSWGCFESDLKRTFIVNIVMIFTHIVSCVKVKLICLPIDKICCSDPPEKELNKEGLNFVLCSQCEINREQDYSFTLLAKFGPRGYIWTDQ